MEQRINRFRRKEHDSQGFTLLELTIALLIMGVVTAGLLSIVNPIVESGKVKTTEKKMERIIDILAIYAQRNNRIPCPGDPDRSNNPPPFGAESGSGSGGTNLGSCSSAGSIIEGIVPYKTLGIAEQDIIDAWGNYLTYRVDPAYTKDPNDNTIQTHARCRTELIWVDSTSSPARNYNPAKARFCCAQGSGANLIIKDENNDQIWPFSRDSSNYADPDSWVASNTAFTTAANNIAMPAFVLISHGHNGYGSFLPDNGGNRMSGLGATGLKEDENQDFYTLGNNKYIVAPRNNVQNNTYFDDIVMWRTQDQLYSETGEGSCVFP